MSEHSIYTWVETAAGQMKFPPDRKYVRQELWDHLIDRREDFLAQGKTMAEAEAAAVAVMGDPVEIGRQLNRIHRPILGWIWKISQILLIAVLVFSLGNVIWNDSFSWYDLLPGVDWELGDCQYGSITYLEEPYTQTPVWTGAVEQAGVYTLTLDHGSWVKTQDWQRLTLGFRLEAESIFDLNPRGFSTRLCAEDDLGNQYKVQDHTVDGLSVSIGCYGGFKNTWRAPYLHLQFDVEDSLERQWIRFYIPGTDFDLTINAEGMVIP